MKEGELVTWDKFFLDERLRKVIELALANNRDLRQSMLEVERLRALYRGVARRALPDGRGSGVRHAVALFD